ATVIVSSSLHMAMSSRLATRVVVADHGLIPPSNGSVSDRGLPDIDPLSLMYVVFTSGSTGQPKGVHIGHSAFSSSIAHQASSLGFLPSARVLDFAPHVFDMFVHNTAVTLSVGGCEVRLPLPMISKDGSILHTQSMSMDHLNAHQGAGVVTWVVNPSDHNRLAPIGAVGELLLEGPLLGDGYLNDAEKTAAAFIHDPAWLVQRTANHPGRHGRLYKTGDLVRYHDDGSLSFVGRKDTQVKIRGQRVELGEVEHHVRECLAAAGTVKQLAAEVIIPYGDDANALLAVFLQDVHEGSKDKNDRGDGLRMLPVPAEVDDLASRLPSYMIPSVYFTLPQLPTTVTDKINRKRLREIGSSLYTQSLADVTSKTTDAKRMPSTDTERALQELWAQTLHLDPTSIGVDDSFFRLGGNSITAMKLVTAGREKRLHFTVPILFQYPKLATLAAHVAFAEPPALENDILPFSLLKQKSTLRDGLFNTLTEYGLDLSCIEDAYPCTPLQEGLLALSAKRPGDYVLRSTLQLGEDINVDRFRAAWDRAVQLVPILRTRIVHDAVHGHLQIVVRDGIHWTEGGNLEDYIKHDQDIPMGLGQPLTRFALTHEASTEITWFVWTIHHALYDGISMRLMLDVVRRLYLQQSPKIASDYKHFIRYLCNQDINAAESFWRTEFIDADYVPFPLLPPSVQTLMANSTLTKSSTLPIIQTLDVTTATLIRGAWAVVIQNHTAVRDVVYGLTVSGRTAPVAGIESIIGPTIATIPTRVRVPLQQSIANYLHGIQHQMEDFIRYEHTGLQKISTVSIAAEEACQFQTLLVIQPGDIDKDAQSGFGGWRTASRGYAFSSHALTLQCFIELSSVRLVADYDDRVLDQWYMERLLDHFIFAISELARAKPEVQLKELSTVTPADRVILWDWNHVVPAAVERCVHDLIDEQVQKSPSAPAVHAWDGQLTYIELDRLATHLAHHLIDVGVTPGTIVPLCFEKSMWTTVAVLGVLKAGAAFCMLEPSHPESRLQAIVQQTGATVIVSSSMHMAMSSRLAEQAILVECDTIPVSDGIVSSRALPHVNSSSLLYVVFTSGSTGVPKAALITHTAFSSNVYYQAPSLGFLPASRVIDLASHAFDVFVHNTLTTLLTGGCLCVPSELDRKNHLLDSIIHFDATLLNITPSVARLLSPSDNFPIQTMLLGGEPSSSWDMQRWSPHLVPINTYGPSECTPMSVVNSHASDATIAARIGKAAGVLTWVVDPTDHDRLVPIGAVGELLLEGPLLGDGYLNDAEKTAAAFIHDPAWLVQRTANHPGRHGRLYKTGDLVRYHDDGSLSFVGRKDTQVKIRGQRVELGEVEYHVQQCLVEAGAIKRLAAEVIIPRGDDTRPLLAVFFQNVHEGGDESKSEYEQGNWRSEEVQIHVLPVPAELGRGLAARLPSYMIPTVYFALSRLPMTATDKIDRRRLRTIGGSFSSQQLADLRSKVPVKKRIPTTDIEVTLQQLWAQALNLDPASIGIDDTFFNLGGDSITAMQISFAARSLQLPISTSDILIKKTIYNLSKHTSISSYSPPIIFSKTGDEPLQQHFALSPIQQLYVNLMTDVTACFEQSFLLRVSGNISVSQLTAALHSLTQHHSMLRGRLSRDYAVVTGHITKSFWPKYT
ncbi:hypothetical protein ZTR_09189, partial [Talaromyces verruculosus]